MTIYDVFYSKNDSLNSDVAAAIGLKRLAIIVCLFLCVLSYVQVYMSSVCESIYNNKQEKKEKGKG